MRRHLWVLMVIIGMFGSVIGCSTVPNEEERSVPTIAPPPVASATPVATASIPPISTEPVVTIPVPTVTPQTGAELPLPAPTVVPDGETRIVQQVTSPDGQWVATTTYTRFDVQGPVEGTFTLTNLQTNEEVLLEALTVTPGQRWLEQVPFALGWTPDSQSFYYRYLGIPIDGCALPFESNLYQYTLATQSLETLSTPSGNGHLFSPTAEQVAYFPMVPADAPPAIAIYTPATDTLQEISFPAFDPSLTFTQDLTGQLLWHPDGSTIALSVLMAPCNNPVPALLLVDVPTSAITVIESGTHFYVLDRWEGDELLLHAHRITRRYDRVLGVWVGE